MQPIVIATDFSPASEKAMLYGGALASTLNREVVLLNVYNFPVVPTLESAVVMVPYEEFHKRSEDRLKKSKRLLLEHYPKLLIETKSSVGEIVDQLNEQADALNPLLVVIGSRERQETGIIFGSTTTAVVKHSNHPVLSVPESYPVAPPRVAVLATDLTPISSSAIENLRAIVQALELELHLVHVVAADRGESHDEVMNSLGDLRADFKTIISNDLSEGIESYTKQLNADLVITLPHSHSWLEGLFMKKHTKELVTELHLPLLCIPE